MFTPEPSEFFDANSFDDEMDHDERTRPDEAAVAQANANAVHLVAGIPVN
jgi:hypothetical protein